jgi:hypothetical protein
MRAGQGRGVVPDSAGALPWSPHFAARNHAQASLGGCGALLLEHGEMHGTACTLVVKEVQVTSLRSLRRRIRLMLVPPPLQGAFQCAAWKTPLADSTPVMCTAVLLLTPWQALPSMQHITATDSVVLGLRGRFPIQALFRLNFFELGPGAVCQDLRTISGDISARLKLSSNELHNMNFPKPTTAQCNATSRQPSRVPEFASGTSRQQSNSLHAETITQRLLNETATRLPSASHNHPLNDLGLKTKHNTKPNGCWHGHRRL